jgi:predicted 2-oxoglutarate/Fe(II)-dependent dioxygenase YbiX
MEQSIDHYLKIYKSKISDKLCNEAIEKIENNFWKQHQFYNPKDESLKALSGNNELDISNSYGHIENQLMEFIWNSFYEYIKELNFSWFAGWQKHSFVRFNRYKENKMMKEHCDHIHSLFDGENKGIPILSALCILNDNYSGGELIFFENKKINVEKGDILIFPSNFMFPHRVEPVTSGIRYTCVSWAW